jgi:hypothetical protein
MLANAHGADQAFFRLAAETGLRIGNPLRFTSATLTLRGCLFRSARQFGTEKSTARKQKRDIETSASHPDSVLTTGRKRKRPGAWARPLGIQIGCGGWI